MSIATAVVWMLVSLVVAHSIHWGARHLRSPEKARGGRYAGRAHGESRESWLAGRYVVDVTSAESRVVRETFTTTWLEMTRWAARRSMATGVTKVEVTRCFRDGATVWTWRGGGQIQMVRTPRPADQPLA